MSTSDVKSPDGINCFFTVFKNVYALEDNEERKILAAILDFWRPFLFFLILHEMPHTSPKLCFGSII